VWLPDVGLNVYGLVVDSTVLPSVQLTKTYPAFGVARSVRGDAQGVVPLGVTDPPAAGLDCTVITQFDAKLAVYVWLPDAGVKVYGLLLDSTVLPSVQFRKV